MPTLVKRTLHSSIAESVFRELGTRGSKFFFFLGKPTGWTTPSSPVDSFSDELQTRNDIILFQEIKPSDACLVVPRIDWQEDEVYDKYDDGLSTELAGINLRKGGLGYVSAPTVNIVGGGPNAQGAQAVATIDNLGRVIDVTLTQKGSGYTQAPAITFTGAFISGGNPENSANVAEAVGVINSSPSGATRLEDAKFYVLTEDFNVYKCLNNNYGAQSTVKPVSTSALPFTTADGYVWKYLYTIPSTLRNKFLTPLFMPVVNALNDNFYNNGEIAEVSIVSGGTGYTWAKIVVAGDGYSKNNPKLIKSNAIITSAGSDYENPSISIQPPFSANVTWTVGLDVVDGEIVSYTNTSDIECFYRVLVSGKLDTVNPPTHRSGNANNGETILEYIGETARAKLTDTNGVISSVKLIGRIYSIEIEDGGSGYTSAPPIFIWPVDGFGSSATATAKTFFGSVSSIDIVNMGDGYEQAPYVFVGKFWVANAEYEIGEQISWGYNLYTVTGKIGNGKTGTVPPSHMAGTQLNGNAQFTYAGRTAKAKARLIHGSGYSFTPTCTVDDSLGSDAVITLTTENSTATITPIISNGSIIGASIDDPGTGYTYANIQVIGDGSNALLRTNFFVGDVNSVQGTSQLLGVDGSIHHIELLSGGYGYTESSRPAITIEGDGIGAEAVAILNETDGGDKLLKIQIEDSGKGYRWANVKFSGGSGFGAKARAVISPYLGHGSDAVAELFANKIMFYTVLSGESLFDFDIENEYRQVGIIKNPRSFVDKSYLVGGLHTPCTIVSGNFDLSKFSDDMEIRNIRTGKKYRIISKTTNTMLLQNLQNEIPSLGDELENQMTGIDLSKFIVESVISPTVDKYSGDLLYIENRPPFRPNISESIALRSILTF